MTDRPTRITLSRAKGWRMPPDTVKVDRITALEAQVAEADRLAEAAQDMADYGTVLAEQKYHRNLDTALAAYRAAKGE